MEKCPNCNARIKDNNECYRCGFDFALVFSCEQTAEVLYFNALASLKKGNIDQARRFCEKAIAIDNSPRIRKLNTFVLLKTFYHA